MNILAKYFFLAVGVVAAAIAVKSDNVAAGIVAAGTFISFAMMEIADFKSRK
ncbi:MAG: hypothetical protein ACHQFX_00685 [Chitinophagales bacterium]